MKSFVTFAVLALFSLSAEAELCKSWDAPKRTGGLEAKDLPEASGLAISPAYPERLYQINDHGNDPSIFVTDFKGAVQQKIEVPGLLTGSPDTESLAIGPCEGKTCVFIGDIGDNKLKRSSIRILWFEEEAEYKTPASTKMISLKYPDGPHNAEAMIVQSNGDVFIFTKAKRKRDAGLLSKVFRLPGAAFTSGGPTATLEPLGEIDVPSLIKQGQTADKVVTDASVAKDGRILLLTYNAVIEMNWNSKDGLKDSNVIPLSLPHQEAVEFLPDGSGMIVTSEQRGNDAPIVEIKCKHSLTEGAATVFPSLADQRYVPPLREHPSD